jgi:cytidylate kinase
MSLEYIKDELKRRDHQDTHRSIDPLMIANDAIVINSDYMMLNDVVNKIISFYMIKKEAR